MPSSIVAVVDDDPGMLESIGYLLDAHGLQVEMFDSAEAFMGRAPFENVSCLVLDIHLGGMSGFDVQRVLSERGSRLPIIFITAVDSEAIADRARDGGCVAFLRKPFSSNGLIDAIRRAIDSKR
jgi:FixJ family two-component response regulator